MKIIYLQILGIIQLQMAFTMEKNLLVVGAMENFSTIQSLENQKVIPIRLKIFLLKMGI